MRALTTARAAFAVLLAALAVLPGGRLLADRGDQRAADDYRKAVALVEKGRHAEAIPLLLGAIARAPEPNEAQGSERRFRTRYDPYYWLGVAQMELGRDDEALTNFERSDSIVAAGYTEPVIRRWEKEYEDLKRRRATLLARLQQEPMPAVTVPVPAPSLPPTPAPALPAATPTPIPIAPAPAPPVPRPTAPIETGDALREARDLASRLQSWSRHPRVGSDLTPILAPAFSRLERAMVEPGRIERVTSEEEERLRATLPRIRRVCLKRIGEDFAAQRWDDALSTVELARQVDPEAGENDVVAAGILATRYLMEGGRDERSLLEARRRFQSWRSRVGPGAPLPRLISPSLASLLIPGAR